MDCNPEQIFAYLDTIYSAPNNQLRVEAYERIEAFLQQLQSVQQLASVLSACQSDVQRNFGLHCLQCFLRNIWNCTTLEDKHQFKTMVFSLVANPDWTKHESLCKVIVELVKREWPQHWPAFVPEMQELSKQNVAPVLSVFLRLSEDVFEFQNVPQQRRKDIMAGLNENVDAIFGIVYNCLVTNVQAYVAMAGQGCADPAAAGATLRLCKLALATLTAFMEWVKTDYLMQEDALLIRMLVQLLPLPHVCYDSSEAVLLFFEQKVKTLESNTYVELVTNTNILQAVAGCLAQLQKQDTVSNFEDNFSQRLCQIVCCIGQHLVSKLITNSNIVPAIFDPIMELLVYLINYPSKPIVFNALKLLLSVVKNEHVLSLVEPSLPALLDGCRLAQLRNGLPSETGHACSGYSQVQFDSDDDYALFFATLRSEACLALQAITQAWPVAVATHLLETLSKDTAALSNQDPAAPLAARSPIVVHWDGLANHCEAVLARLPTCLDSGGVDPASSDRVRDGAKAATDALLNAAPVCQPQLRTCLLTALTAFLPFLASDRGLTLRAVQCVFNTLRDTPGSRNRAQREMRKHAVVCLLRLCKTWPDGVLPLLNEYCTEVTQLCQLDQLSVFESASLIESVVLLSNHLPELSSRRATIEGIMLTTMEQWLAPDLSGALSDPARFLRAIGLDRPTADSVANFQAGRIQLHQCLMTIYNAVRSCSAPTDGHASPVAELAGRAWPNLLRFAHCLHCLHTPAMRALFHPDYSRVFDLDNCQKCQIMGIPYSRKRAEDGEAESAGKTPIQKMHTFLTEAHSTVLRAIAHTYKSVPDIVDDWQLAEHLASESDLPHLPDLLLTDVIRSLSSVAVRDRPAVTGELAGHFCRRLLDHTLARLNERWTAFAANSNDNDNNCGDADGEGDGDGDADLSDEVISEQCLRRLSRAFLDLLHCLLLCGRTGGGGLNQGTAASAMDSSSTLPVPLVEREPQLAAGVLTCLYEAIAWPDGPASQRAAVWAGPVTRQLAGQLAADSDAPRRLLMQVLRALHQHGASGEAAVACLVQLFLCLYDCFHRADAFRTGLAEWTRQPAAKLEELDSRLGLRPGSRPVAEKTKRDVARRFLESVIGKPLSEQFKLAQNYKNLPPLFKAAWRRKRTEDANGRENLDGIVSLFASVENAAS
ncbi:hypothetical protein BOX15_Mlig005506g2 [Macrostomum lignano]|uniref:Importin N-terminal domain-containing protein n=1 Tax=Macrostomum lignano TaxID=282301 RepID=A0A267GFC3_9PLAT|nr:hypothetical protein BOX15_Mlig005506g2 [Macrostomum lignano]